MSKAEERALEAYPIAMSQHSDNCKEYDSNESDRLTFIKGYQQAEKDLELTWDDMMIIHKCIKDAMNYKLYKMMEGIEGQKEVYEEVLKRFKDLKNENQEL